MDSDVPGTVTHSVRLRTVTELVKVMVPDSVVLVTLTVTLPMTVTWWDSVAPGNAAPHSSQVAFICATLSCVFQLFRSWIGVKPVLIIKGTHQTTTKKSKKTRTSKIRTMTKKDMDNKDEVKTKMTKTETNKGK